MTENTRSSGVSLEIGARAWDHEGWVGPFFPEDLPDDWRLAYYANEFRALLVPPGAWSRSPQDDLESWCEEVDESFRFVLEMPEYHAPRIARLLFQARAPVRERVAGLLFDSLPDSLSLATLVRRLPWAILSVRSSNLPEIPQPAERLPDLDVEPCWTPERPPCGGRGRIGLVPAEVGRASPRTVRGWLESFLRFCVGARSAYLFFEGKPPDLQTMRDAVAIAGLLGACRTQG